MPLPHLVVPAQLLLLLLHYSALASILLFGYLNGRAGDATLPSEQQEAAVKVRSPVHSMEALCSNIDRRLPCSVPHHVYRPVEAEAAAAAASQGAQVGSFIGESTGESIRAFFASPDACPVYVEAYGSSPSFRRFIEEYMAAHEPVFPSEHAELVAMATAAKVPPATAFIQNACSELQLLFGDDDAGFDPLHPVALHPPPIRAPYLAAAVPTTRPKGDGGHEHCSDIGLLRRAPRDDAGSEGSGRAVGVSALQGHNEDWKASVAPHMAVVSTPSWTSYAYPGQLAGTSLVVNSVGLSLTMNSVYPTAPGYHHESMPDGDGTAYVFAYVLRSVVNCTSTEAVVAQLGRFPVYSGYSVNVVEGCGRDDAASVANIEGYGGAVSVQRARGRDVVRSGGASAHIGHYNAYIHPNSPAPQDLSQGTSVRRRECEQHTSFRSEHDVRSFLGDLTACPVFFTDLNGAHKSETMGTWIVDPVERRLRMYRLPVACEAMAAEGVWASRCPAGAESPSPSVDRSSSSRGSVPGPDEYPWHFTCPGD